jgi:Spy/CpxP family protein refolding chaperone
MKANRGQLLVGALALTLGTAMGVSQTAGQTTPGVGQHARGFGQGGRMFGFFADYLDMTDAQQAQMKDILSKEQPTIQPLLQQLAQSHQQIRQLEASAPFDETKVRALATQQSQTMTELLVQKSRIKSELMQILTPEQKAKMAKFEARKEARFLKHLQQGQAAPAPPNE